MPQDWKDILAEKFGATVPESSEAEPEPAENQPLRKQRLIVSIDRRHRSGKQVTLVTGFSGPESELEALGKVLKTRCGTGGTVKDGEILIQGDVRDKVVAMLTEMGHQAKRGN
ncbi:MAG: translation initiation factor [Bacteroidales bacterium]|nr:translation initiation factor [Bacteroidales bacterium]